MTKPDFSKMTRQELRDYVLAHREDDDAIEALIKEEIPAVQPIHSHKPTRI